MRVAHLTTVDSSLRYLLLPQLLAVIEDGGQVTGISAPGPDVEFLEDLGVRHLPLGSSTRSMNVMADLRSAAELWRILRRHRFDVLHTHNPKPGLYGRVVGRLAGVPIIVHTTHGLYATTDDRLLKRAGIYAMEAVASRFSDAELVQNPEDVDLMGRLRIISRRKMRLLGNGVDLERFNPARFDPGSKRSLRRSLGIAEDAVVVGAVGRLVLEKGYVEMFEAAAQLGDDFVFLVVGPEDPVKADAVPPGIIETAKRAGVVFAGHRPDVDQMYAVMDVLVHPSYREGFPRAPMEAAAMGLPVVATDIRGCRQAVEHGVTGLLVPARDAGALAMALSQLRSADVRVRMGRAARGKAVAQFDEREVVARVMDTYRSVRQRKAISS